MVHCVCGAYSPDCSRRLSVCIDDAWQGLRAPPEGALQGNDRFPDMGKPCDEVHALGLKIGLYSTPWRISFAGYAGEEADTPDGKYFRRPGRPARHPEIHVDWPAVGVAGRCVVRDLWRQKDAGEFEGSFTAKQVPSHGVLLVRIIPAGAGGAARPQPRGGGQ